MYGDIELGKDLQKLTGRLDSMEEYTDYLKRVITHNARAEKSINEYFESKFRYTGKCLTWIGILFLVHGLWNFIQDKSYEALSERVEKLEKQDEDVKNS